MTISGMTIYAIIIVYFCSMKLIELFMFIRTFDLFILQGNDLMRILNVAAFAVSGYASTKGWQWKPFNPILGETYEADYPDKGLRFLSEKVALLYSTELPHSNYSILSLLCFLGSIGNFH